MFSLSLTGAPSFARGGAALILLLCLAAAAPPISAEQFANPLDVLIADPSILREGTEYYLYGTTTGSSFEAWSSTDLVNWRSRGTVYQPAPTAWGQNRFWAPEVVKKEGLYYLFYSAGGPPGNAMRICVAAAASPLGPFADLAAPLFDDGKAYIDPHVFLDEDGTAYLYVSQDMSYPADNKSEIYAARLNSTFTGLVTGLTLCITPDTAWEIAGGGFKWNEAPAVLKHAGYYYLLYSGNLYSSADYAVGYATSTSPVGPWTKYPGNPVLKKTSSVSGPGHSAVTSSPDGTELWMVYHTHQQSSGGGARQLAIDLMAFAAQPSGPPQLSVPGAPRITLRTAPAGGTPFPAGGTDEFDGLTLDRSKWMVFSENPSGYSLAGGRLNLTLEPGDTYQGSSDMKNIFLQYPPSADFRIVAKLQFTPQQNIDLAFVTVWQDHNNYVRFAELYLGGKLLEFGAETNGTFTGNFAGNALGPQKYLRTDKIGQTYSCYVSPDAVNWTKVGPSRQLNFTDIKVGFGAASPGNAGGRVAAFDSFTVLPVVSGVDDWALY